MRLLLLLLFFCINSYSQSDFIFIKLDTSVNVDSISFKDNYIDTLNDTFKFKKKRNFEFSVTANGELYKFKIRSNKLGMLNVVSLQKAISPGRIDIELEKGNAIVTNHYGVCQDNCFTLRFESFNLIVDNGKLRTLSDDFNKDIKRSPNFYFR